MDLQNVAKTFAKSTQHVIAKSTICNMLLQNEFCKFIVQIAARSFLKICTREGQECGGSTGSEYARALNVCLCKMLKRDMYIRKKNHSETYKSQETCINEKRPIDMKRDLQTRLIYTKKDSQRDQYI